MDDSTLEKELRSLRPQEVSASTKAAIAHRLATGHPPTSLGRRAWRMRVAVAAVLVAAVALFGLVAFRDHGEEPGGPQVSAPPVFAHPRDFRLGTYRLGMGDLATSLDSLLDRHAGRRLQDDASTFRLTSVRNHIETLLNGGER